MRGRFVATSQIDLSRYRVKDNDDYYSDLAGAYMPTPPPVIPNKPNTVKKTQKEKSQKK